MVRGVLPEEKEKYNKLVTHPLQSWEWGDFRKKLGQKVFRIGHFAKGKMVKAYQFFFHSLPRTSLTIGYFPKGPSPDKKMVEVLRKIGKRNKAIFIKTEPNVLKSQIKNSRLFATLGFLPGKPIFTKYTSIVDLRNSEEELLAKMHPKTRYNIRLAQRHQVEVKEDNSPSSFEEFLDLFFETARRQGFYAHNKDFHRLQWQILRPAGISHLLTAKYKGKMLAAFILFVFNKVLYYPYGCSTREHKEVMAPTLLMWEAIRFGKKIGCQAFDLWGETAPEVKPSDPWYGWHRFKKGFGPEVVEFVGSYDLVLNPVAYQVYKVADFLRWKFLRFKSKFK